MTDFTFQKASKKQVKARIAIDGPSGSGKTYTALVAATALANNGKIAVIDTEHGSASLYSDHFSFDVLELASFSPETYTHAIHAAERAGYSVILIDSLSHAWEGEGGALDLADDAARRQKTPNSYTAWKEVTPIHRKMVDAILSSSAHIAATMRSKMDYVQEKDSNGRTLIRKIGLAPVQRAGMEYEFTLVGDMDLDHTIVISKSRCPALADARRPPRGGAHLPGPPHHAASRGVRFGQKRLGDDFGANARAIAHGEGEQLGRLSGGVGHGAMDLRVSGNYRLKTGGSTPILRS